MSKKIIFSVTLVTALFLTSCNRDETSKNENTTPTENTQSKPNTPETKTKPSDSYMGTRGVAKNWKVDANIFLEKIEIADLYDNPEKITTNILKDLVTFEASEPEGKNHYILTEEDFPHLGIQDLNYDGQNITFYTSYKGVKSSFKSSLPFNSTEYYQKKILVNKDYVSNHYMRGIYENDLYGWVLSFDRQKYDVDLTKDGKYKDDHNNTLRFTLEVTDKQTNKTTTITKEVEGFKTLKQLADDLSITSTGQLETLVKTKLTELKNRNLLNNDLTKQLQNVFINQKWIQQTTITVKSNGDVLSWLDNEHLTGEQNNIDIYLDNPKFALTSASLNGNDLHMVIEFQHTNDGLVINKTYNIIAHNVNP